MQLKRALTSVACDASGGSVRARECIAVDPLSRASFSRSRPGRKPAPSRATELAASAGYLNFRNGNEKLGRMFAEDLEFHPGLRPDGIWPTSSLDSSGMLAR